MFVDKYVYIYTCVCTSNWLQDQEELWFDPTDFEHVELLALAGQKEDVEKEEEKDERGDEDVKGEEEEEREERGDDDVKGEEEEEKEEREKDDVERDEEVNEEREEDDVERDEEKEKEKKSKKRRRRRRESSDEDEEYLSRRADHYLERLQRSRARRENRDG